jgi:hypothetical protein
MIYTAPRIMFWMRAYPLRGEVGGLGPGILEYFLGTVKLERADRRVPFGPPPPPFQNLLEKKRKM